MSGGHYDYVQYKIDQVADEVYQDILNNSKKDEWGHCNDFSEETLERFRECENCLRIAAAMLQRVDYLISGDDGEETFHERWKKEVPKRGY